MRKTKYGVVEKLMASDCHCFEVTEVTGLVHELEGNPKWLIRDDQKFFLPSPLTWLEWLMKLDARTMRMGAMLEAWEPKNDDGDKAEIVLIDIYTHENDNTKEQINQIMIYRGRDGRIKISSGDLFNDELEVNHDRLGAQKTDDRRVVRMICAMLSLINTPHIIGRRTHLPHAGLQKQIARNKGMVGKYPLQAWTEIKLEVTPTRYDPSEHETRLTGGKALHFCRKHLRIRFGKVEIVSSHWRGDPALGIKQSRYSVVPPQPHHRAQ